MRGQETEANKSESERESTVDDIKDKVGEDKNLVLCMMVMTEDRLGRLGALPKTKEQWSKEVQGRKANKTHHSIAFCLRAISAPPRSSGLTPTLIDSESLSSLLSCFHSFNNLHP